MWLLVYHGYSVFWSIDWFLTCFLVLVDFRFDLLAVSLLNGFIVVRSVSSFLAFLRLLGV